MLKKDIYGLLKCLDPYKVHDPDEASLYAQKEIANILNELLEILFNMLLEEDVMPKEWKKVNIMPIFKKGNWKIVLNYKPVSLKSVVCKTLEKIIRKQMDDYLQRRNYLSEKHHGFRERRSCITNLFDFYDRVKLHFRKKEDD